ncbi:MAG: GxxExxY protein [Blastochloris sp.]|nr:GxxExxY protein [Blastochloris sp.]
MIAKKTELEDIGRLTFESCLLVHRTLGPGLLESVYEKALAFELAERGLQILCQKDIPVSYRSVRLDCGFRADIIVEKCLLLELKAVDALTSTHKAQVLTYLKLTGLTLGFLVNFNVNLLKNGFHRVVLNHPESPSRSSRLRG